MVDVVTEMKSFWTLSMPGLAVRQRPDARVKIVSNGPDKTLGNMVPKRVQQMIDDFQLTFGEMSDTADPNVKPEHDHDEQVHRSEHRTCDGRSSTASEHTDTADRSRAVLDLRGVGKDMAERHRRGRRRQLRPQARRLRVARRTVRLWQVDGSSDRRRDSRSRRRVASSDPTLLRVASSSSRTCWRGAISLRNVELYAELDGMPSERAPRARRRTRSSSSG